jgi:NAD(P)H-dependent FMN reductase
LVTLDPREYVNDGQQGLSADDVARTIDASDAFLVVTPEYNHGYTGELKRLIDAAQSEWGGKPVGFISYGGKAGGARAIEQLRQVFAELHTVTLRDAVSFTNVWETFDQRGPRRNLDAYERQLLRMMSYLRWWGTMLKAARGRQPYKLIAA